MIWGWLLALLLISLGLILWLGKVPASGRPLVAAALMLGMTGYALQGLPNLNGAPVARVADDDGFGDRLGVANGQMSERYGPATQWMAMADSFVRRGKTELAVGTLQAGLKKYPDNVDLWVAMANALVAHGGGAMNPAAAMAFDEAADRSPDHPAPPFFAGLALAQGGDLAGAEAVWSELLARSAADAPWRADLEARLVQLRTAQVGLTSAAGSSGN